MILKINEMTAPLRFKVLNVSAIYEAHKHLNIYIQHTKKLYKLSKDQDNEFILIPTEIHLITQPAIIEG